MIVSVNSKPDLIEFKNLMLKTDRALNEDAKKDQNIMQLEAAILWRMM